MYYGLLCLPCLLYGPFLRYFVSASSCATAAPRRHGFITEDALAELECNRESKPVPTSMKQDIEMGMKRSVSLAKIKANKGSTNSLVARAAGNGHANGNGTHTPSSSSDGSSPVKSASDMKDRSPFSSAGNEAAGSALPFEPLNLTFQDVGYSVAVSKDTPSTDHRIAKDGPHAGQLQLLHHVSGSFRPGVLTALMGASGAGKTTLMDVLAGRKTGGKTSGDIRVNGHPKEAQSFARVSAYVEQEDAHLAQCTVREALEFSAALRLPTDMPSEVRASFVDEVMGVVELRRMAEAMIGHLGHGTGLTIEQRKRLTIAVEMVANPSILFMDEPTTGEAPVPV